MLDWFGPSSRRSGGQLGEFLSLVSGTDEPKAMVQTGPDLNPCASCSHAPSPCIIDSSSACLTFC